MRDQINFCGQKEESNYSIPFSDVVGYINYYQQYSQGYINVVSSQTKKYWAIYPSPSTHRSKVYIHFSVHEAKFIWKELLYLIYTLECGNK